MKIHLFSTVQEMIRGGLRKKQKAKKGIPDEIPTLKRDQMAPVQDNMRSGVSSILDTPGRNGQGSLSLHDIVNKQQRVIDRQRNIIGEQWETIRDQEDIISRESRISWLLLATSFAVWGILSGVGASLYSQISPDSGAQSFLSSLSKKFSDTKTGYELIKEGEANIAVMKKQEGALKEANKSLGVSKQMEGYQSELAGLQTVIIAGLQEQVEQEKLSCGRLGKNTQQGIMPSQGGEKKGKISRKLTSPDTSAIFATVSKIRSEIMPGFSQENAEMRIQEQSGGRVLVWMEYKGKKSLGFFADSPKFQVRLTKQGMSIWIQNSIDQLSMVEQIESLARARNIHSAQNSAISLKIQKMYTGEIGVVLSDAFSKKTERFTVNTKTDKPEDVTRKMDAILEGFVS